MKNWRLFQVLELRAETMADTVDKLKQMEEEMNRFEAEIAHQGTDSDSATTLSGGFTFPAATAFIPPQLRLHHTNPVAVQTAYPVLPMPPGISLYVPMSQPTLSCFPFTMPPAPPPTAPVYVQPKVPTTQSMSVKAEFNPPRAKGPEIVQPTQKVITAPPQMAGPTELAARAKEAAAAAAAAKSKMADDDDDVTRALLAAAAGVTYTRTQGPNGKEKVVASITKPPLTPVVPQTVTKTKSDEAASNLQTNKPVQTLLPPPTLPPAYRSAQTSTANAGYSTTKKKRYIRAAAGSSWEDPTLADWDPNDFRIFCGDLGNEVNDDTLARAFNRYPSFQRARVVRDKRTSKSRGYGFVSFSDPNDFTRAMREMNGKYVGNRPIKLKRSDWQNRQLEVIRKREKEKKKLGLKN